MVMDTLTTEHCKYRRIDVCDLPSIYVHDIDSHGYYESFAACLSLQCIETPQEMLYCTRYTYLITDVLI